VSIAVDVREFPSDGATSIVISVSRGAPKKLCAPPPTFSFVAQKIFALEKCGMLRPVVRYVVPSKHLDAAAAYVLMVAKCVCRCRQSHPAHMNEAGMRLRSEFLLRVSCKPRQLLTHLFSIPSSSFRCAVSIIQLPCSQSTTLANIGGVLLDLWLDLFRIRSRE
jgi:hypothetical protein